MERLVIDNFIVIKKADLSLHKLNILIGSQATGKSVIAKLLYFFHEFSHKTLANCAFANDTVRDLKKCALDDFEKYFPQYTWKEQIFTIQYMDDDFSISLINNAKSPLRITFSKFVYKAFNTLKLRMSKARDRVNHITSKQRAKDTTIPDEIRPAIIRYKIEHGMPDIKELFPLFLDSTSNTSSFIPASRSFFANLQRTVFSFLSTNIPIDPFLKDFGANYEIAKQIYHDSRGMYADASDNVLHQKIEQLVTSILVGQYKYQGRQDWIEHKKRMVNLAHSSSGQQESLPMLLILSIWPFLERSKHQHTFFIEEPEAHLFPISQQYIANLIGLLINRKSARFVITTHSPYILTAFNNLILLSDLTHTTSHDKMSPIIDIDYAIDYGDVSAFTIKDGTMTCIMDNDARLIGTSTIDSASDSLDTIFDSLLTLKMAQ